MVAFYIQNTKKVLIILLLVIFFQEGNCQIIDCDQLFNEDKQEIIGVPEKIARPCGSFEVFYEKIKGEINDTKETGKVFIRFVVDTLGNVHCSKVVKSDNEHLNAKALEIIEKTKFTPAMNRGKKIIAPMVLPITFGEPTEEKKKKP